MIDSNLNRIMSRSVGHRARYSLICSGGNESHRQPQWWNARVAAAYSITV